MHAQPLFDHIAQLLRLQGLEIDLNGDVFLHEVIEEGVLHPALDFEEGRDLLCKGSEVNAAGIGFIVLISFYQFLKGRLIIDLHLNGHQILHGDVKVVLHSKLTE